MKLYFVDTWYFIAVVDPRDASHRAVIRLEQITSHSGMLVTHDGVLGEFLTFFGGMGDLFRVRAAEYVRRLLEDPGITVLESNRPLFLASLSLYERRRDKEYSMVDCMSMHLMQTHGITQVLTNDHHFRQEGFEVVSDAP